MAIPRILGALDVDLVLHIFRKMPKERQMKSLADYGNRFYIEMSQHARTVPPNPWSSAAASSSTSASTPATSARTQSRVHPLFSNEGETPA